VPLLAQIALSVELAFRHCLPDSRPILKTRKQRLPSSDALFSPGKQWHTDVPLEV
jgi:hypothetical protein